MVNETRIQRYIDSFEQETKIPVSPLARHLIIISLDAIERDPNPRWGVDTAELESYADEIAREVPALLRSVVEHSDAEGGITYFNVLHFLSRNLKSICPFPSE